MCLKVCVKLAAMAREVAACASSSTRSLGCVCCVCVCVYMWICVYVCMYVCVCVVCSNVPALGQHIIHHKRIVGEGSDEGVACAHACDGVTLTLPPNPNLKP